MQQKMLKFFLFFNRNFQQKNVDKFINKKLDFMLFLFLSLSRKKII